MNGSLATAASVGAPPTSMEMVDDLAAFARLEPEWDELLAASESDGLFLTWEWMFTWWRHLGKGCKLQIIVLRSGGLLIAVAPLALRPGSLLGVPPVATLQFLGSGVAGSDYLDLIVRRGHEADAITKLSERLSHWGRGLALMRMLPGSHAAALVNGLRERRWRAWQGPAEACPFVSLRGQSFESYLGSLGAEHRYAFRRKLTRMERRREPSFELVQTEPERKQALATLFELHAMRWRERGDVGAFSTQSLRDFHDDVSRLALAQGWLRLWVLRFGTKPVAALYGFLRRRTFYFYQAGFDPASSRDSVGLVILGVAVRAAIQEGADELDLLHGTEGYKAHWAKTTRELVRYELYAPGARGFLESEATALTREARRITRSVLEMSNRAPAESAVAKNVEPR